MTAAMEKFLSLFSHIVEMDAAELKIDMKLKSLSGWDSIAAVSLLAMIDAEYGIKVTAEDLRQVKTIQDVYKLVRKS